MQINQVDIKEILSDKSLKPKGRTAKISNLLFQKKISIPEIIKFAKSAKDPDKATCIEAIEYATKNNQRFGTIECLEFAIDSLKEKAPRVKWESAKVVGNIITLFPKFADAATANLLENSKHEGTVVRWSVAFALGEIIKLRTKTNTKLIPLIEKMIQKEEKESIKKIYKNSLKFIE